MADNEHAMAGGGPGIPAQGSAPADPWDALEHEMVVLLRRARSISEDSARMVDPTLGAAAYGLLLRIDDQGAARAKELSDFFGLDKSTISRQISLLEELGLIDREPDPLDGRARRLILTERGRERVHAARTRRRVNFRSRVDDWDRNDVALLAQLLGRLNALYAG
ncbi:MAG: transcriptional regulator, MarR family [Mycobacterium sp.]|nr:transcriptional regulator, MarR family [Mycobacterium sp.]